MLAASEESVALAYATAVVLCLRRDSSNKHQWQHHRGITSLALEESHVLEQRVLTFKQTKLYNEQQEHQYAYCLELFVIVAIYSALGFFLREFGEFVVKLSLRVTIVIHVDISATASLGYFAAHILIETCHHGVASTVFHISAVAVGNGSATGRTDSKHIHSHTLLAGIFSSLNSSSLVVFAVGDDDDCLADAFLLCEAVHSLTDGKGNIGSLSGYE